MKKIAICCATSALGATLAHHETAQAFSVENHVELTTAAVAQVVACVSGYPGRWDHLRGVELPGRAELLSTCNTKQDDLRRKVMMWHFPQRGQPIPGSPWQAPFTAGATSFDQYFHDVATTLRTDVQAVEIYPAVGTLLHYLQDAAVPAHAVPIFHPSARWGGDNFDGYPVAPFQPANDLATCERLLDGGAQLASLQTLLDSTIDGTLEAIQRPIATSEVAFTGRASALSKVPRDWTLFWDLRREADGFANYGCVGDRFGKGGLRCRQPGRNPKVEISPKAYSDFAADRHRAAVHASVQAIAFSLRSKPGEGTLQTTAKCPVPHSTTPGQLSVAYVDVAISPAAQGPAPAVVPIPPQPPLPPDDDPPDADERASLEAERSREQAQAKVLRALGPAAGAAPSSKRSSKSESQTGGETETEDAYTAGLQQLRGDYHEARELFGSDHVSLFPMFYAGKRCDDGSNRWLGSNACDTQSQSGVAGVIFLPLWGVGGGHGSDWWPILDTEDEAAAFLRFEQRAAKLTDAMAKLGAVPESPVTETHYQLLAGVFEDVLKRDIDDEGASASRSQELLDCLAELSASGADAAEKIQSLNDLWREYTLLAGASDYKRRHNFLLGPSYAVPLTEEITRVYLLGLTAEVGGSHWGVSANVGLRYQYDAGAPIKDAQGWFVGLGLSGELTDDLLNVISGASSAGAKLRGASNGQ